MPGIFSAPIIIIASVNRLGLAALLLHKQRGDFFRQLYVWKNKILFDWHSAVDRSEMEARGTGSSG